ncbi:MAG: hypothetical protein AAFS07_19425, partial [Pseudomonadota bacterium]
EPLASYPRTVATHQRIGFDVDPCGRFLATGSDDAHVLVYELATGEQVLRLPVPCAGHAVNGVGFSPVSTEPLLAVATGTRRFPLPGDGGSGSEEEVPAPSADANLLAEGEEEPYQLRLYALGQAAADGASDCPDAPPAADACLHAPEPAGLAPAAAGPAGPAGAAPATTAASAVSVRSAG